MAIQDQKIKAIVAVDPDSGDAMDWADLRFAFIHSSESIEDFAIRYAVDEKALKGRVFGVGKWLAERKKIAVEIEVEAHRLVVAKRAKDLAEFNDADLTMARTLRSMAGLRVRQLKDIYEKKPHWEIPAHELRSLAGVVETAQRVGRLALGASTENMELGGKLGVSKEAAPTIIIGGPPEADEPAHPEELLALEHRVQEGE